MWDWIGCIWTDFKGGLNCVVGNHRWSSKANEGIKPTLEQLDNGVEGFKDYATMYCKECGMVSHLSEDY